MGHLFGCWHAQRAIPGHDGDGALVARGLFFSDRLSIQVFRLWVLPGHFPLATPSSPNLPHEIILVAGSQTSQTLIAVERQAALTTANRSGWLRPVSLCMSFVSPGLYRPRLSLLANGAGSVSRSSRSLSLVVSSHHPRHQDPKTFVWKTFPRS
jgi:hypothetical protein